MYTQSELDQLNDDLRKRWIIYAIPALLLLALQVYSLTLRIEPLTIALAILVCFWSVFYISLQILPVIRYRTHVYSVLHGITHTVRAVFDHLDLDDSLVEGVNYRAMHVLCQDEKGDDYERLFYWDLQKPLPAYEKGQTLEITYHDREIADIRTV
jgi:hypothetical protein